MKVMSQKISYDVVLNQNLVLKGLKLAQIHVILDITGVDADPLTLQQIRDESSIRDCFLARRKNINDALVSTASELKKAKTEQQGVQLVNELNQTLESQVKTLQKELQTRVNSFAEKQKKQVNDLFWARAKIVVRVVYAVVKFIKGAIELPAKVTAGIASMGFLSVIAIKALISSANDAMGAYNEFASARESEREQFKKLDLAVKELKKIKSPQTVPQSKIDAVEGALGPYGARLLGEDAAAKNLATKLDKLLTDLEKGKFRNKQAQKQAETAVQGLIDKIQETTKNIAKGRTLLQSARDKVRDAGKRAQKDPTSFWDLAAGLWKAVDYVIDMGESAAEGSDVKDALKKALKTLQDKLKEEEVDARMEEATAV